MLNPISVIPSQQGLGKVGDCKTGARFRSGTCGGAIAGSSTTAIGGTWATGEVVAVSFTPYHPNGTAGDAIEVSATVGATTTTAAVAALLQAAFQNSAASGYAVASLSSSTITFTGRGTIQFALATGSTSSTSSGTYTHTNNVTTATVPPDVKVGRAVVLTTVGYQSGTPDIKAPVVADFTAQSWAWAIANLSASSELLARGTFAGIPFQARAIFDTDNNTTVAGLATALETVFNASPFTAGKSLVASAASGTLTVAADIAGNVFSMTVEAVTDTNVTIALTRTGTVGNPTYDFMAKLIGFTASSSGTMPSGGYSGGVAVYPGNSTAKICADGEIVLFSTAPTAGLGIWIGLDTTDPGAPYSAISGSTSPVWCPAQITHDGYVSLRALNLP